MWKYVKAAFSLTTRIPVIGPLPLNWLALASGVIIGFAFHPLWLGVAGFELIYLYWLGTNRRFHAVIDGQALQPVIDTQTKFQIYQKLEQPARDRLGFLEEKFAEIITLFSPAGFVISTAEPSALDPKYPAPRRANCAA